MKIKLMFWNIQSVYEYKMVLPEELKAEAGDGRAPEQENPAKRNKTMDKSQKKADQTNGLYRRAIVEIISAIDPDIIAIVEFAVGKNDIIAKGEVKGGNVHLVHWGPMQIQVELNEYNEQKLSRSRKYLSPAEASALINASDLGNNLTASGDTITELSHKNSMFELYGIIWDDNKLNMKSNHIEITKIGKDGAGLVFDQRDPGYAQFEGKDGKHLFDLVMIHSVFGTTLSGREKTVRNLSQLKVVHNALNANRPIAIAGDFNLDFKSEEPSYDPLTKDIKMIPRINAQTSLRNSTRYLNNAYDNIFTRGFKNDTQRGSSYDFVQEHFLRFEPQIAEALKISDHLPVFCELEF